MLTLSRLCRQRLPEFRAAWAEIADELEAILEEASGGDALACLGHPDVRTPALDRLASEGALFTNAHVMGSGHGAVCVPSRAMLLSGRSLFRCDESLRDTDVAPRYR